jgi:hypothetical protein
MSTDSNSPAGLAFSTRCLPGSVAEQQEQERLKEFEQTKALRKAEEELTKAASAAKRQVAYEIAFEANQERMRRKRAPQDSVNRLTRG